MEINPDDVLKTTSKNFTKEQSLELVCRIMHNNLLVMQLLKSTQRENYK